MTFSIQFFIFIILSAIAFYTIRPKMLRIYLITIVSLGFCCTFGIINGLTLLFTTIVAYFAAFLLDTVKKSGNTKKARYVYIISILIFLLSLFVFKYAFWIMCKVLKVENLRPALESIVLPLGISFYTFGIIDYLTDVYKGKTEFVKNPIYFAAYAMYFPKIISGPIEDSVSFMDKLKGLGTVKLFDSGRIARILSSLLTGYFMKTVIADRALVFVQEIFLHPDYYGTGILILGSLLYTIQIYFDFAGYSLIAIGISEIFGIRLMDNFKTPYFSENITEFWRRWHISLSNWLKEYIYIPLGGNRKGIKRQYLNVFIVFLVCGVWHGAAFRFVFWGILHGVYSICARFIEKKNIKPLMFLIKGVTGRIVTFICVSFAWIFFGSEYLRGALKYIGFMVGHLGERMGHYSFFEGYRLFSDKYIEFAILTVMVIVFTIFEYISYRKSITVDAFIMQQKSILRYIIWYLLIMSILVFGMYGTHVSDSAFIYMQF